MGIGKVEPTLAISDNDTVLRTQIIRFSEEKKQGRKKELEIMERRARCYYILEGTLFRQTFLLSNAKYLSQPEGILVLREAHEGGCLEHAGARSLARKIL